MFGLKFSGSGAGQEPEDRVSPWAILNGILKGQTPGDTIHEERQRARKEKLFNDFASALEEGRNAQMNTQPLPQVDGSLPRPAVDPKQEMLDRMARSLGQASGLSDLPMKRLPATPDVGPIDMQTLPQRRPTPSPDIYAKMLPQIIRAQGDGIDTGDLPRIAKEGDYVSGVPQKDRARATMDPLGYAKWASDMDLPMITNAGDGHIVAMDRRTGQRVGGYDLPRKPDPVTTDRVVGSVIDKARRGETLTPHEQGIYDRWAKGTDGDRPEPDRRPTTSTVVGAVLDKVGRVGIEGLTPGERALWDRYNNGTADDDDEGGPPARPGAAPPARFTPPSGQPPQAALAQLKPGINTTFANGQVWTVRGGKPTRVK